MLKQLQKTRGIEENNGNNSEDDQSPSSPKKPSKALPSFKDQQSSYKSPPTKLKVPIETSSNGAEDSHNDDEHNDNEEDSGDDYGSQSEEFNDGKSM
ncbi:hypothetical protein JHK87_006462 [Glycine soja]|nr:hypothetical protein JHK87_006462 [Glycine soja]